MKLFKNKWDNKESTDSSDYGFIDFILTDVNEKDAYIKVVRGIENIPSWYKELPHKKILRVGDKVEDLTVKRCIPVLDAVTAGYYLVTTKDITIKYDKKKGWSDFKGNFNPEKPEISMHPASQVGDMPFSDEFSKYAYKWSNPYTIKTPTGYSVLFSHPLNAPYLPFYTLSGVVDTDTYFQPVLFPFLAKNNFSGVIPAGTPIVQIIPFRRDSWKHEVITNGMSSRFLAKRSIVSSNYEGERYDKDGNPVGGMYKRYFRKIKHFL